MPTIFDNPQSLFDPADNLPDPAAYLPDPAGGATGESIFSNDTSIFDGPPTPIQQRPPSAKTQIAAGIDMGQALAWESANQLAHILGFSGTETQKYLEDQAAENKALARNVPALDLWDNVLQGAGTLLAATPFVAGAGLAGATVGLGAPALAAGGALTSAGFNLGDLSFKAKELDKDFTVSGSDVALAGALGAAELLPAARVYKSLSNVAPAMGEGLMTALKAGAKTGGITIAQAGAVEAGQDFATNVKAYQSVGEPITEKAISQFVDDAILEATVGAILIGPVGALQTASETVARMAPDRVIEEIDPDTGEKDLYYDAPTMGAVEDPGLWRTTAARLFGRATDRIGLDLSGLDSWTRLRENFVQNKVERAEMTAAGRKTITQDIREQLIDADLRRGAQREFFDAPDDVAEAAMTAKLQGLREVEDSAVQRALDGIWAMDENLKKKVAADDLPVHLRGDTYVPFNPDFQRIIDNSEEFIADMQADLVAQGLEESEIQTYMDNTVKPYLANIQKNGQYRWDNKTSVKLHNRLVSALEAMEKTADPAARRKIAKRVNKTIRGKGAAVDKANPLEQERLLGQISDSALNKWSSGSAKDIYLTHTKRIGQRLAHIEKWGTENEKYWEAVSEILVEAAEKGRSIDAAAMDQFVDLITVAQKLPTKQVSVRTRKAMRTIRFLQNVAKLPLALIPSIVESLFVMDEFGAVKTTNSAGEVVWNGIKKKAGKLPKVGTQRTLDELAMSMDEATSIMASRVADETFNPMIWETRFFNVTGLPQFTEGLRMTAAIQAEKSIIQYANDLESTNRRKVQRAAQALSEAGLDLNEVRQWVQDPDKYDSPYYYDNIRPATLALAEDVVVHPTPVKKPIWHSNENLMLVSHLKSFATVFTNGIMRNWWDKLTTGTTPEQLQFAGRLFPLMVTFIAMQSGLAGLREWLKTGDTERWDEKEFGEHVLTGISYLGTFGMGVESAHIGGWGFSPVESLLGPTAGDAGKILSAIGRSMAAPEDTLNEMIGTGIRLLPAVPGSGAIKETLKEGLVSGNDEGS